MVKEEPGLDDATEGDGGEASRGPGSSPDSSSATPLQAFPNGVHFLGQLQPKVEFDESDGEKEEEEGQRIKRPLKQEDPEDDGFAAKVPRLSNQISITKIQSRGVLRTDRSQAEAMQEEMLSQDPLEDPLAGPPSSVQQPKLKTAPSKRKRASTKKSAVQNPTDLKQDDQTNSVDSNQSPNGQQNSTICLLRSALTNQMSKFESQSQDRIPAGANREGLQLSIRPVPSQAANEAFLTPSPEEAPDRKSPDAAAVVTSGRGSPSDQYDKFAEHVAAQLRELPLRNAISLQKEIQCLITAERLICLADN